MVQFYETFLLQVRLLLVTSCFYEASHGCKYTTRSIAATAVSGGSDISGW